MKKFVYFSLLMSSTTLTPQEDLIPFDVQRMLSNQEIDLSSIPQTPQAVLLENVEYLNNLKTISCCSHIYSILGSIRKFYFDGETPATQADLTDSERQEYVSSLTSTYMFLPTSYIALISSLTDYAGNKEFAIKREFPELSDQIRKLNLLHKSVFLKLCAILDSFMKRAYTVGVGEIPLLVNKLIANNKAIEYDLQQRNMLN